MSKHLTDPERLALLQDYISGSYSKHAFCKLHDLDLSRWLNRFGLEDKPSPRTMKKNKAPISHSTQSELEAELARLKKENLQLRNRLRYEALGHEAYKRLVEPAEEAYGIPIRKNSEAK